MLAVLLFALPSLRPFSQVSTSNREDGCGMGFVDIFPPSACQMKAGRKKLVLDQRRPEVMPSLETWSFLFLTGPFSVRNSSQESELLPLLSHQLPDASAEEEAVPWLSWLLWLGSGSSGSPARLFLLEKQSLKGEVPWPLPLYCCLGKPFGAEERWSCLQSEEPGWGGSAVCVQVPLPTKTSPGSVNSCFLEK